MQSQNPLPATTLVVWGVLRYTHEQMTLHLLNITNWWCFVREYWINQIMPCITRYCCIFKQICQVKLSWNPPNPDNTCIPSLPNTVVIDGIMHIVQGWCGYTYLLTTGMLSQNTSAGPSTGIPKPLNLYLRDSIIYVTILRKKTIQNLKPQLCSYVYCNIW